MTHAENTNDDNSEPGVDSSIDIWNEVELSLLEVPNALAVKKGSYDFNNFNTFLMIITFLASLSGFGMLQATPLDSFPHYYSSEIQEYVSTAYIFQYSFSIVFLIMLGYTFGRNAITGVTNNYMRCLYLTGLGLLLYGGGWLCCSSLTWLGYIFVVLAVLSFAAAYYYWSKHKYEVGDWKAIAHLYKNRFLTVECNDEVGLYERRDVAAKEEIFSPTGKLDNRKSIMNLMGGDTKVNIQNIKGQTALHILADRINILPALQEGADANVKDQKGQTPLHKLAYRRTDDFGRFYDLDLPDPENYSRLFEKRQRDFCDLLILHNADVNSKDNNGDTPLHIASLRANKNMVTVLLDNKADMNATNNSGETILHYAVKSKEKVKYVTRLLLSEGADVNARNVEGRTPLHRLAQSGDTGRAEILLSSGADINAADNAGKTPLHCAVKKGHARFVELLLSKGADINAKASDGSTPLDLAARKKKDTLTLVKILSSHAHLTQKPPLDNDTVPVRSDGQQKKLKAFGKDKRGIESKTSFSVADIHRLEKRAQQADDPMAVLAAFTSLHIKKGFTLRAYPYRVFEGAVGNVWAVPESSDTGMPDLEECEIIDFWELPRPFPIEGSCMDGLTMRGPVKLLRPPEALDNIMEAIEGDGTPWSYLSASIFAREIAEFGAAWHGAVWSFHKILEAEPLDAIDWDWLDPKPSEWKPSVASEDKLITVRFYTDNRMGTVGIYCYTDIYRRNGYKFGWDVRQIAYGGRGLGM